MVKKSKFLKSLVYTFAFVVSFFTLFNNRVSGASGDIVNYEIKDNVFLTLEEQASGDYSIVGGYHTCSDSDCLGDLVIPSSYNGKNIVSIADAESNISVGVLDGLKEIVSGKITISDGIEVVGMRAFYQFRNVKEVHLASSVISIGDYAFDESGVEKIYISRYEGRNVTSVRDSSFAFAESLSKIVFPTQSVSGLYEEYYRDILDADILGKFTYEVKFVYHYENADCSSTTCVSQIYYPGDKVSLPTDPVKTGFRFMHWLSMSGGNELKNGEFVFTTDSEKHFVAKWALKELDVEIATYYNNAPLAENKITYAGTNVFLEMRVSVDHELKNGAQFSYKWVKKGELGDEELEGITGNIHKIQFVNQSGVYSCTVTMSYNGQTVEKTVSLYATIAPRDLLIKVNDNTTKYGAYVGAKLINGSYFTYDSTVLVEGEIVKEDDIVSEEYTTDSKGNTDLQVGVYRDVLKIVVSNIGYEGENENYISNYNISYDYGDLIIEKKDIVVNLTDNISLVYGQEESDELTIDYTDDSVYGGEKLLKISYNRETPNNKNVGEYKITSISVSDTNYNAFFSKQSKAKVVIIPRAVAVLWQVDDNLVYDGNEKSVSAVFKDINDEDVALKVSAKKNNVSSVIVNAGEYVLTADMIVNNINYTLVGESKTIVIDKAESILLGNQTQTTTYNGISQRVEVSANHNEKQVKYSDYRSCKNAHTITQSPCAITAYVEESENYYPVSKVFYLRIKPIELKVTPKVFKISYGRAIGMENLNDTYTGINGEEVLVFFSKEGSSSSLDVGYYNIANAYIYGTNNYTVVMEENSGLNKIQIVPAELEVKFYFYENLAYDGKEKDVQIQVTGTSEPVDVVVDYNGKSVIKNAGKYRIDVSVNNDNYCIKGKNYIEFEIAKAKYNMNGIKLRDKEVRFNFNSHTIVLDGELPMGVNAKYTIDDRVGNGTYLPFSHVVKVTFDGDFQNYEYIEPLEATLYINMTWVFVTLGITIFVVMIAIIAFILLLKYEIIRFVDKEQKKRLRNVVRRNRAILAINEMFKENKKMLEVVEEDIIIEEDVTFVKNVVDTPPQAMIMLSFVDKLFRADKGTKEYYSEVKNELLSYEGIVSKIKRDYETFYVNNVPVAKLDVVDGDLQVYFALDPTQYKKEEYKHVNVSKQKDFVAVPMKLTVKSIESLRFAKMFIRILRKREKLKFTSNFIRIDYVSVYTAKENSLRLFKKRRVKRGSKESIED